VSVTLELSKTTPVSMERALHPDSLAEDETIVLANFDVLNVVPSQTWLLCTIVKHGYQTRELFRWRSRFAIGIGARIVTTLRCFYSDLHANIFIWSGAESRPISVQRGVRQGDPLSTLLFNLVLNEVLEEVGIVWRRRSYGADMGSFLWKERLDHVAFADDCTLEARSWLSLKRMILYFREALQRSIAEKRSVLQRSIAEKHCREEVQKNPTSWTQRGNVHLAEGFAITFLPGFFR
jgi:hypothetical protein